MIKIELQIIIDRSKFYLFSISLRGYILDELSVVKIYKKRYIGAKLLGKELKSECQAAREHGC